MINSLKNEITEALLKINKASVILNKINSRIESSTPQTAIPLLYDYQRLSERIVNQARTIPLLTGNKTSYPDIKRVILEETGAEITISDNIFRMHLPSLLSRKEKGNASYIRAVALSCLEKYFSENNVDKLDEPAVIVFKHNYNRPEKKCRDHDNIEINVIVDLIALFYLKDDSAFLLDHFYFSKKEKTESTDIFVVPSAVFSAWLKENF